MRTHVYSILRSLIASSVFFTTSIISCRAPSTIFTLENEEDLVTGMLRAGCSIAGGVTTGVSATTGVSSAGVFFATASVAG
ncbi:MAG: hypothetical protein ACYTFK_04285 [Planctomycetota bacterium]